MENKINIAELLKDCPKGMELDCASYDNVSFDKISDDKKATYPIFCYITDKEGNRSGISFTENGCESKRYGAKCVIFPKGKTTWEGFQRPFKDGDVIYNRLQKKICIYYLCEDEVPRIKGCRYNESNPRLQFEKLKHTIPIAIQDYRLATGEEKVKFFKAIENNGYQWNPETKTLVKIPKFKDGDVVVDDSGALFIYKQIHPLYNKPYADFYCGLTSKLRYFVIKAGELQHCGEISSLRYATEEEKEELFNAINDNDYCWNEETKTLEKLIKPKFKVGDCVVEKGSISVPMSITKVDEEYYYYNTANSVDVFSIKEQDKYKLVPNKFDITTLVPFESRVLVRGADEGLWKPAIYGFLHSNGHYVVGGACWKQCIPYKGNEHLCGTTNVCNDYFKTWKDE